MLSFLKLIVRGLRTYLAAVRAPRSELTDEDRIDMQIW